MKTSIKNFIIGILILAVLTGCSIFGGVTEEDIDEIMLVISSGISASVIGTPEMTTEGDTTTIVYPGSNGASCTMVMTVSDMDVTGYSTYVFDNYSTASSNYVITGTINSLISGTVLAKTFTMTGDLDATGGVVADLSVDMTMIGSALNGSVTANGEVWDLN